MKAEARRAQLVETARSLFFTQGYEATSVEHIIAAAQISKGAFYHHFSSKGAVLEALADHIAEQAAEESRVVLGAPGLNAFERLQLLLRHHRGLKIERASEILNLFHSLFRPENLALHHRVFVRVSGRIIPIIAEVLEQGMADGTFLPGDPGLTAEIVVAMATLTHSAVAEVLAAEDDLSFERAARSFEKRLEAQGIAVDRVLGLPEGSVEFIEPGFARAFFAGWRNRAGRRLYTPRISGLPGA